MQPLIGIIGGKGKMGQYFADFFKDNGFEVIVSDRGTKLSNADVAKKADVVMVSVPIGIATDVIAEVAPLVKKEGLLMDLTSIKVAPMQSMKTTQASYLGCHPMFGPTNSIQGQTVILCKGKGSKWYQWWKRLLEKNQVEVRELSAKAHDDLMSYVQVLSHFSDLVLVDTLAKSGIDIDHFLDYQSPPYRLKLNMMGRILNQDPNLYAHIQIQNPNSLKIMSDFKQVVDDWISIVDKKDIKAFEKRFKKSSDYLGDYKKLAMEESDFLIEQMNRQPTIHSVKAEPLSSYDLVALGPENTFSSMAARQFKAEAKVYLASSITEVFELIKKGEIKQGIVPVENKLTGSVLETLNNLFEGNLVIQDELFLPIHHCLVALHKDDKKIKTIYSHPQAIKQCRQYLKKNYPKVSCLSFPSTIAGLEKLISERRYDTAVICSEAAAKAYRLPLLDASIEDYALNETRFIVIGKNKPLFQKAISKTSIAFYFSADAPGTLHEVLGEFAEAKVNMTKIESAANPEVPGGYLFYVDFEGSTEDAKIKKILQKIKGQVKKLKILGCY